MDRCPNCGAPVTSDDVFCGSCGQNLTQPPATPSQSSGYGSAAPPPPPMPGPPPVSPGGVSSPSPVAPASSPGPVTPGYGSTPVQPSQGPVVMPTVQPTYQSPPPTYSPPPTGMAQPAQPPKKKLSGCVIAIIVVAALALCGIVIVGGITLLPEIIPSDPPTATPYVGNTTTSNNEVPLDVVNDSNTTICYLYISPSTSDEWGEDWLMEIGTIEPGFSATFYLPVGEMVDMQLEDCDGNILDDQYNVTVPPEGLTYTLSP